MHARGLLLGSMLFVCTFQQAHADNPYAPSYYAEHTGHPHYLGATNGAGRPSLFFPGYGYGNPAWLRSHPHHHIPLKCFENPYGPADAHEPVVYYRSPTYGMVFHSPCPSDPPYWWRTYRPAKGGVNSNTGTPSEEDPRRRPAQISLHLPHPNTTVTVEGVVTKQTGTQRQFVTPALESDTAHLYTVSATWQEDGQTISITKEVTVRAGEEQVVDFTHTPTSLTARP